MFFRRKAILLIHGFVGGIYDFGSLGNELEVYKNFDVYSFTLPGHEKNVVKDVKYQQWIKSAEEQINFLIEHKYKEIYVIGHSMGGVIAAHLASTYPQVKRLVLAAPAFRYFYFKDGKINIKGFNETIKSMPSLLKEEGREKVIERIAKTPITTMLEFTKLVDKYQNCLEKITCPTLIIHGLSDSVVPKEGTDLVHEKIKSKTNILINIKDVTHDCFIGKKKKEVINEIITFLRKHPKNINKEIDN